MCLVMFVIVHGSNGNTCVNMPIHISQTYAIYFEGGRGTAELEPGFLPQFTPLLFLMRPVGGNHIRLHEPTISKQTSDLLEATRINVF